MNDQSEQTDIYVVLKDGGEYRYKDASARMQGTAVVVETRTDSKQAPEVLAVYDSNKIDHLVRY